MVKMKNKKIFAGLLSFILILNATLISVPVSAASSARGVTSTFSVSATGRTFTISRDSAATAEDVRYRTVGLSALPGIHFTGAEGILSFGVGDYSRTVTVSETASKDIPIEYRYQSGTFREYAFEVLDIAGFLLAETTRKITYDNKYRFSNTFVNSSVTDLIYLNCQSSQSFRSNTSNYTDIAYAASTNTLIRVKDSGYSQAVHTVPTSDLFTHTGGIPAEYFSAVGDDMYVSVGYTVQEVYDGYAYIQILADNDTTCDGSDSNATVSTPSTSLYKACYEIDDTTTAQTSDRKAYFPHRYDYKNREAGGQGLSWTEFSDSHGYLYKQLFKNASYRADNSGSLKVSPAAENINIRFDGAGSGKDDWDFKDLFVRLAIADTKAPGVVNVAFTPNFTAKRNRITVNLIFDEIVNASATVLHTTWGNLSVRQNSSSRSNIVAYSGFITAEPGTSFRITGLEGSVRDLIGNSADISITKSYSTAVSTLSTPAVTSNGYNISCLSDFYWYADRASAGQTNIPAILTSDINVPTNSIPGITAMGGT